MSFGVWYTKSDKTLLPDQKTRCAKRCRVDAGTLALPSQHFSESLGTSAFHVGGIGVGRVCGGVHADELVLSPGIAGGGVA